MKKRRYFLADFLWGEKSHINLLLFVAAILIFTMLGGREIWTQEHRWADIVTGMFYRHDFIHPYLGNNHYYDKPLLSYWLIIAFSFLSGELSATTLRLPSAISALLAIYSLYLLGLKLKNKQFGLLSAWMLVTTYYFLFWARISSADMLNLSGTLLAVTWYFYHCERAKFRDYVIFYLILAITSLCKGLIGAIVPLIAVFLDMLIRKTLKQHLRWSMLFAIIPGLLVYLIPFVISAFFDSQSYGQNGLYLVYKENILRYFKPFDHRGSIYTYFLYLPIYLLPWSIFLFPTLFNLLSNWIPRIRAGRYARYQFMDKSDQWIGWTVFIVFIFFTLSGSRRSYYVLPLVPFGILMIASYIAANLIKWQKTVSHLLIISFLVLFASLDLFPAWYYHQFGINQFASLLKADAQKQKPWHEWNLLMLDAESKLNFYLNLPPTFKYFDVVGERDNQTQDTLIRAWPTLGKLPKNTIIITRKRYERLLAQHLHSSYHIVQQPILTFSWFNLQKSDVPIAFVPNQMNV